MFNLGDRVKVKSLDRGLWHLEAIRAFEGQLGTVQDIKCETFKRDEISHLIQFDKPIQKWAMLSQDESDPINFHTHFHFTPSELEEV